MLSLVENLLEITPTVSNVGDFAHNIKLIFCSGEKIAVRQLNRGICIQGNRRPFVMETVKADDAAKLGMCGKSCCLGIK